MIPSAGQREVPTAGSFRIGNKPVTARQVDRLAGLTVAVCLHTYMALSTPPAFRWNRGDAWGIPSAAQRSLLPRGSFRIGIKPVPARKVEELRGLRWAGVLCPF